MEITRRRQLVELLKYYKLPLIGVELGVAGGAFSEELLESGIEKLYSIDIWEYMPVYGDGAADQQVHDANYEQTLTRLHKYKDRSVVIKDFSHRGASKFTDETLGLVYQDAGHDLISVQADITYWWPKLVPGGIFAFHDYDNESYGVKAAVRYFATNNNREIHLIPENGPGDSGCWMIKPLN